MDELDQWWAAAKPRQRRLGRDEPLFHRGARVESIFRVEQGRVRLERRTIDGRLLVLHATRPGEFVAEASLFAEAYHCDASAAEPSIVSSCPRTSLLAAMNADSAKAVIFAQLLARQLQTVRHRLELRNIRSARERILVYLELNAEGATRRLALPSQLQDIAAELGLTREAFYRALAALERDGSIGREPGAITLI